MLKRVTALFLLHP